MVTIVLLLIITVGMMIDIFSCTLSIRRNRHGSGPSGFPVVTLIVFYLLPLIFSKHAVFTRFYLLDALILLCFHIGVVFVIPIIHRRMLASKSSK
jgi:hypothetical protein